jgi:hypothetical protein
VSHQSAHRKRGPIMAGKKDKIKENKVKKPKKEKTDKDAVKK